MSRRLVVWLVMLVAGACTPAGPGRVIVLGFSGLDAGAVDHLLAQGQLPNFARLRREGAYARLSSPQPAPSQPSPWLVAATGRQPPGRPVWDIVAAAGRPVASVGWWGAWPAAGAGVRVSDAAYDAGFEGRADAIHPLAWRARVRAVFESPAPIEPLAGFADPLAYQGALHTLTASDGYARLGLSLWQAERPDLLLVALRAPEVLSGVEGARLAPAVTRVCENADRILGEYLAVLDARSSLIVMSDRGLAPDTPGWLSLYGRGVRRGGRMKGPSALDITPSILALCGLGVARDMPGRVLAEALEFTPTAPAVASYELAPDPRAQAAAWFASGRHAEAAAEYRRLIAQSPEDAALRTSLAGILGAMGRYAEALEQLEVAVRREPLNPEAYHNRGAVFEKLGRTADAIAQYRLAAKYSPAYEPARRALLRLTGSADPDPPRSDAERRARELAEQAKASARAGDFGQATVLLDAAERLAPRSALVQQYRSNVAYLRGDVAGAIRALEAALVRDPGNALFAENLGRLRRAPASPAS